MPGEKPDRPGKTRGLIQDMLAHRPALDERPAPVEPPRPDHISLFARAIVGQLSIIAEVLQDAFDMPQDDPLVIHRTANLATDSITDFSPVFPFAAVTRVMTISQAGAAGVATVRLFHPTYPVAAGGTMGSKIVAQAGVGSNASQTMSGFAFRIPRGAQISITTTGAATDLFLNLIYVRQRETGDNLFRGRR